MSGVDVLDAMTSRQTASRRPVDFADRLTIWAIWALLIGGGPVREILGWTQIVSTGVFTLHSVDPAIVLSLLAVCAHLFRQRLAWHLFTPPILVMSGLIVINFMRGMSVEPPAALLWIRADGGIATMLALAVVMRPIEPVMRSTKNALIFCSVVMCVLLLLRIATHPTLFMTYDVSDADANDGGRGLSVYGTFVMTVTGVVMMSDLLRQNRFRLTLPNIFALALPIFILLTRQGTASIAAIVAYGIVFAIQRGKLHSARIWLSVFLGAAALALVLVVLPQVSANQYLAHRADNLGTRQSVWHALMSVWPDLPWMTQFFGYPGGQGPKLFVFNAGVYRVWSNSMHSMYYGSLPIMGYVGLACYLMMLVLLTLSSFSGSLRRVHSIPAYPAACCVATVILSVSYEVRSECLCGLFIAIWWLRAARGVPVQQRAAPPPHFGIRAGAVTPLAGTH
jgi:hypothetical protein